MLLCEGGGDKVGRRRDARGIVCLFVFLLVGIWFRRCATNNYNDGPRDRIKEAFFAFFFFFLE